MKIEHQETTGQGRFEARDDKKFAGKLNYTLKDENTLVIDHTEVDPGFQGEGVGMDLVKEVAEYARENNMKIIPVCSYAQKVMERTSDYDDVLN